MTMELFSYNFTILDESMDTITIATEDSAFVDSTNAKIMLCLKSVVDILKSANIYVQISRVGSSGRNFDNQDN